jgi:hypothetical protein
LLIGSIDIVEARDEQSVPPLARAELDYARGAVVGAVSVDRRKAADGSTGMVITIHRATPVLRVAVAMAIIGAIATSTALLLRYVPARPWVVVESLWIVAALAGLAWMIAGASQTLAAIRPRAIEISRELLSILVRRERDVVRAEFARRAIVDVLIEPVSIQRAILTRDACRATAVHATGERIHLHEGTRAETEFIRETLVAELQLPAKPWVETGLSRTRWPSRMHVRIDPYGVQVKQPARATWLLLTITLIASIGLPFAYTFWRMHFAGRSWERIWEREAPPLWGVGALIGGLLLSLVVYNFRRSVTLTLNPRLLTVSESSPLRPALSEWPTSQLKSFATRKPKRGRRMSIEITLDDGSHAPVLEGLTKRDARVAIELMAVGLVRAQSIRG